MSTILCVDDNDSNLFLLRAILGRAGFDVLVAVDGEEGLEVARTAKPDLVLMDLMLPGIDGLEATRRLKGDDATRGTPVIALSAHEEDEKGPVARAAGCDDYARKPLDVRSLLEKIQRLLAPA